MKKKITLSILTFIAVLAVQAQTSFVKKLIIVNEGHYDYTNSVQIIPVTVATFDPSSKVYTIIDTILNARFATNVIVSDGSIYIAADSTIIRYDADTYQRINTTNVRGVRKLAIWNNQLLVSRGEYAMTFDSYFSVLDKNDLSVLYDLPTTAGPQYASEGIIVKNDVAYVAIGNGFDWGHEVGLIGLVNLNNGSYMNEINLGAGATNPESMFEDNGNIYTVNNTDYSTASISSLNLGTKVPQTTNLASTAGCGASGYAAGFIMYQVSFDSQLGRFNTTSMHVQDTLMINRNIYGMVTDEINHLFYVGETDYTTYGKIFIYDYNGALQGSFDAGVSPGNIALDIRTTTGVAAMKGNAALTCYPNPVHDQVLVVNGNKEKVTDTYVLTDLAGRGINTMTSNLSSFTIDMHGIEAGIYILRSLTDPSETVKIVKQ